MGASGTPPSTTRRVMSMNRILVAIAVAALPLAACQKAPDVTYQEEGYKRSPQMAPTAPKTSVVQKVEQAPAVASSHPTGLERFRRDFGNEGRFVYERGFRLDTWTGCVTDGRTGVPVMDNHYEPECGYTDRAPEKG